MGASEGGAPKDFSEAQKWFRKASEQGNSGAEIELGVLYEEGNGVPQDHAEAARWYRKAAEKGNALAQILLANLYLEGRGLPQSLVDAHMWYNLAAAAGVSLAAEYRDLIEKRMTPDQITRAQELARNWHARSETVTESPERHTLGSIGSGLRLAVSGTGFVVGPPGFVVTNEHVVEGCRSVRTQIAGRPRTLATVTADQSNDLALLELAGGSNRPTATFRAGRGPRVGETVVTVGYPLSGLLADSPTVTTGVLSALAGPGNDARLMQITAPIQQGSSGSPLLDASGNVVGIVVSKLDALRVASLTGDVPQNVNFAIKASVVRAFLEANGVEFRTTASTAERDTPALADQARKYTIPLECWK